MMFTPYWLDTSTPGPDRSTTELGGHVDVAVVEAGLTAGRTHEWSGGRQPWRNLTFKRIPGHVGTPSFLRFPGASTRPSTSSNSTVTVRTDPRGHRC